jgi:hypothetical protein
VDCPIDDIFSGFSLNTQTDVDNFQADFGPCDTVTKSIFMEFGPYTNLNGLSDIVTIVGDLKIISTSSGTASSLSGLTSLISLGGLTIEDSNYIKSIPAMPSLTSLDRLVLFNVRTMTDMSGFPGGVTSINEIRLGSMDSLQTLNGLSALSGIQELRLEDNPMLTSISALAGSTFDDSYVSPHQAPRLYIYDNPLLASLEGLPSVLAPGVLSEMVLGNCPLIASLDELAGLVEVFGPVEVQSNTSLSECSALFRVVDAFDDCLLGPYVPTRDPTTSPPDVINGGLYLDANATGCNSIAEIVGSGGDGGVFADGFEGDANN